MPHVIVKLWPGKPETQKQQLAPRITEAVTSVLDYGADSVSVAMEEIPSGEWADMVYRSDILNGTARLYKKPGYRM